MEWLKLSSFKPIESAIEVSTPDGLGTVEHGLVSKKIEATSAWSASDSDRSGDEPEQLLLHGRGAHDNDKRRDRHKKKRKKEMHKHKAGHHKRLRYDRFIPNTKAARRFIRLNYGYRADFLSSGGAFLFACRFLL